MPESVPQSARQRLASGWCVALSSVRVNTQTLAGPPLKTCRAQVNAFENVLTEQGDHQVNRRRHNVPGKWFLGTRDRKSTRLNSSHVSISYAVFCLKKKRIQLVCNMLFV